MVVQGDPLATECRRLVWPRMVASVGPWMVPSLVTNPTTPPEALNLVGGENVVAVMKPSLARSPPNAKMAGGAPLAVDVVAEEVEEGWCGIEVG